MTMLKMPPISKVWPSAGARATKSVPMSEPAPVRFSTTTPCLSKSVRRTAKLRARMSVPPPAA